jgi:glycosyltransferase involved in cell wall biosynthesis
LVPPLRVLHALGTLDAGGVERWFLQVCKNMDRERLQFDFCTFGDHAGMYTNEVKQLGCRVWRCPFTRNMWSLGRRFRRIVRTGAYDVVHSHVHLFSGVLLRWAKIEGVRVRIAHSHIAFDDRRTVYGRAYYRRLMKRWIGQYATHGLAASELAGEELFGNGWRSDRRFRILHYGIDVDSFQVARKTDAILREFEIPLDSNIVGHVGRFVPQKNHEFVLSVARETVTREPETHFLLVGDGPLRAVMEKRCKEMGLSENVHFAGTRSDIPQIMGAIDVLLLPSLFEGLPVTLIEAQAAGLFCIVSRAVTSEARILPEQVFPMDLSAEISEWATKTIHLLKKGKPDRQHAAKILAESDFNIQRSSALLSQVYGIDQEQKRAA